jgi:hypothetical protein
MVKKLPFEAPQPLTVPDPGRSAVEAVIPRAVIRGADQGAGRRPD